MNMKQAVVHVFQNFANFNGRARRSEYWYFQFHTGMLALKAAFYFSNIMQGGPIANEFRNLMLLYTQ